MNEEPGEEQYDWHDAGECGHHEYLWPAIESLIAGGRPLQVLDAGCGNGFITSQFARLGHCVAGIDLSEHGIELARRANPSVRFEVRSVYDDLEKILPNGGWDLIVALEVIEHLFSPRAFLDNMHRYLRPTGNLLLSTPYHGYVKNLAISLANGWDRHHTVDWECGHIKFFSPRTLARMLESSGFASPTFRYVGRISLLWKSMLCIAAKNWKAA